MHFEKDKDEHVDLGEKKEKIKLQISAQLLNLVREYKKKKRRLFWVLILVVCGLP